MTCVLDFFVPGSPSHAITFVNFCPIMGSEESLISYNHVGRHYLGFSLMEYLESALCEVPSAVQVDYAVGLYNLDTRVHLTKPPLSVMHDQRPWHRVLQHLGFQRLANALLF